VGKDTNGDWWWVVRKQKRGAFKPLFNHSIQQQPPDRFVPYHPVNYNNLTYGQRIYIYGDGLCGGGCSADLCCPGYQSAPGH